MRVSSSLSVGWASNPLVALLLVWGCSGDDRAAAAETDQGPAPGGEGIAPVAVQAPSDGYPDGPYGERNPAVGEVVEDLALRGLFNPNGDEVAAGLSVEEVSFQDFREQGHRLLLLITAMGWCGSCQGAAREIGAELGERVAVLHGRGAGVTHLLLQGSGSDPPSDEELVNWAGAADLRISVLGPTDGRAATVFPEREWGFILRLDTMEVVWRTEVALYATPSVSQQGVEELSRRAAALDE